MLTSNTYKFHKLKILTHYFANLHPLYFITVATLAGICWGLGLYWWANLFTLVTSLYCATTKHHKTAIIASMLTALACGYIRVNSYINRFETLQTHAAQTPLNVVCTVIDFKKLENKTTKWCITARINTAQQSITQLPDHKLEEATIQIFCNMQEKLEPWDTIIVQQCNFAQHERNKPFTLHLMRSGIDLTLYKPKFLTKKKTLDSSKINRASLQISFLQSINKKLFSYTGTLFNSIFLGYKHVAQKRILTIKQQFRLWGIEHYLARSGLHMALLSFLWLLILSIIPLSLNIKFLTLLACSGIYAFYTCASISFLRTFLLFCAYKLLCLWDAPINTLHTITLLTLALIISNPIHIIFLDFQLSFILAASLVWIHVAMRQKHKAWTQTLEYKELYHLR